MSVVPEHEWPCPPPGGCTADDLDRLPNPPAHTELLMDGSPVWQVENAGGKPVLNVFAREPGLQPYVVTGIHRDEPEVPAPFQIEIGPTPVDQYGQRS